MTNLLERPIRRCRPSRDIVPFSECRNKLSAMIAQTHETRHPILITQNGRAASYLVDAQDLDNLIDRMELSRSIEISRREFAEGKFQYEDEVFDEMEAMLDEMQANGECS